MEKRLVLLSLMFGILFILSIGVVSAGVYFSQPEQTYNLGDIIINDVSISPIEQGFLKIDLVCGLSSLNVFNNVPIDGTAHIEFPLTTAYIQNISGTCYFLSYYNGQEKLSRDFKISKRLNVQLDIDSLFAEPDEEIIISGFAERLNGIGVNGEVEIRIIGLVDSVLDTDDNETETENNETDVDEDEEDEIDEEIEDEEVETEIIDDYDSGIYSGRVEAGEFSITIELAEDVPSRDYTLEVLVYEQDSNNVKTSEGIGRANLRVSQVLTNIDIALSEQSVDPGADFNFKPMLIDQSGVNIDEEVSVVIRNSRAERIFERIVKSEETISPNFPGNMSKGYYEIEASKSEMSFIKKFYINEKAVVSFELVNGTLIVTNIGNVRYDQDIEVELNGKPFVKKVDLRVGESQEFKLTGSGEEYSVRVSDGETEYSPGNVVLTGNAIGVKSLGRGLGNAFSNPIVWIFIIIILGGLILFIFKNVLKKKSFAYPFKGRFKKKIKDLRVIPRESKLESKEGVSKKEEEKSEKSQESKKDEGGKGSKELEVPEGLNAPNKAEQVLVLRGQKNKATVLVLKIKNKLTKVAKQSLERAIEPIYEKKGAVYEQGDFIYVIYSPLMTKSFKNEVEAAKAGEKIKLVLQEHNKKFKDKIEFGLAINSGQIINKVEDKKLKFTALGNLISGAKRLADSSNEQILVTKEAYEKGISEIKAEKKEIKGTEVYEVRNVIDKEKNAKFIGDFLKRIGGEKK
tara:strand:- start:1347 stop:3572 length:2226 start_codon:yes stop_codon:yes gene_type:complete